MDGELEQNGSGRANVGLGSGKRRQAVVRHTGASISEYRYHRLKIGILPPKARIFSIPLRDV